MLCFIENGDDYEKILRDILFNFMDDWSVWMYEYNSVQ